MKWWFIFFLRGIAVGGPFDTQEECTKALKAEIDKPVLDQGFDHAVPDGLCFQAIHPNRAARVLGLTRGIKNPPENNR